MKRAPNPWDRFYHEHEAPWRGERAIAKWLPIQGRALELGCGNGKLLRPLQDAGVEVVGLDISFNVLRRVGGVLADASALPFADGSFAAVFDVHCTGHLLAPGRARALAEIHRVLVPGGLLVQERLTPSDLRARKGAEVEPGTRRLQDGRTTHFTAVEEAGRLEGFDVLDVDVQTRTQKIRGAGVVRESVCVTATRQ